MYEMRLPIALLSEWNWYEYRGYLPPMPGELAERPEGYFLQLTEAEAWGFAEACEALGGDLGACLRPEYLQHIVDLLQQIA